MCECDLCGRACVEGCQSSCQQSHFLIWLRFMRAHERVSVRVFYAYDAFLKFDYALF